MLLGRWGSCSIERYVQEAELDSFVLPRQNTLPVPSTQPELELLRERVGSLADVVEKLQSRPDLIIAKKAHLRNERELERLPTLWKTKCGLGAQ